MGVKRNPDIRKRPENPKKAYKLPNKPENKQEKKVLYSVYGEMERWLGEDPESMKDYGIKKKEVTSSKKALKKAMKNMMDGAEEEAKWGLDLMVKYPEVDKMFTKKEKNHYVKSALDYYEPNELDYLQREKERIQLQKMKQKVAALEKKLYPKKS